MRILYITKIYNIFYFYKYFKLYLTLATCLEKPNFEFMRTSLITLIKTAFILIFCLLQGSLWSQTVEADVDYRNYYRDINKARHLISTKKYTEAIKSYRLIFSNYDFQFARDCINAAELAAFVGDHDQCLIFLNYALRRGVDLDFIEHHSKFSAFRATEQWNKLQNQAPILFSLYSKSIDKSLKQEIDLMFEQDQNIRSQYYRWYNIPRRSALAKKWEALNKKQVERIMEITAEHGFPGESVIGISEDLDGYSCAKPIVILIHHFSQANPSYHSTLKQEVIAGRLYVEHYATISDYEAEYGQAKYQNDGYYGIRFQTKNLDKKEIDKKRKDIGLMSISEWSAIDKTEVITRFWRRLY